MPAITPMPATVPYWNFIKDTSDEVKLNLITLLSMSIEQHRLHNNVEEGKALEPYSIEELQEQIAKSEQEYERGDFYSQEEAHQLMEQFVQQKIKTA